VADGTAPLAARLEEDMKAALRAGDKLRLGVIRRARAAVQNAAIAARGELSDAQIERVLRGIVKQHRESIAQFEAAARADRADQERREMAILEEYLPPPLDAAAIEGIVREAIDAIGAAGPADMGATMKAALARMGGRADGREVGAIARRLLEEKARSER
jgi:hypothetical protein